jgi:hypothetical protein
MPDHPEVVQAEDDFAFGARDLLPSIENWLLSLLEVSEFMTQRKGLLFIDGTVKSGKTLVAGRLFPFLVDHLRRNSVEARVRGLNFAFTYLDLSVLHGTVTVDGKWVKLEQELMSIFGEHWQPPAEAASAYLRVRGGLRALKDVEGAPSMWFLALDEYHFLFQGLNQVRIVAQFCPGLLALTIVIPVTGRSRQHRHGHEAGIAGQ